MGSKGAREEVTKMPETETADLPDIDFANFTEYLSLKIPVRCGQKYGLVQTYSKREHLRNSLLKNYKEELTDLIERKKYCDSTRYASDLGPTIAVANMIEDGEYADFVQKYNHGDIQLSGLEHVLKVRERIKDNWSTYHLMPKREEHLFGNVEQYGVMQYAMVKKVFGEKKKIDNMDIEKAKWICEVFKEGNNRGKIIREQILEKARVIRFEGYPREYYNCVIYENLYDRFIETLEISKEDVELTEDVAKIFLGNNPGHV